MFAWSHTTYAYWKGLLFHFEDKLDLDYFLAHAEGSERISAKRAYDNYNRGFIRVFSSRRYGANKDRQQRIKRWKQEVWQHI